MRIYDALVIGAGPAGAIFAKEVATQAPELSIALINETSDDRPKVCGGLLAPDAQKILAKLDPLLTGTISSKIPMRDDLTFFTKHPNLFPILLVSCAVIVFALPSVKHCIKNKKEDI